MSGESFQEKVLSELNAIKSDVALLKLDVRDLRKDRNWIMAIGGGMILFVFAPITVAVILGILKIVGVI